MASKNDTTQALLDRIHALASDDPTQYEAGVILELAEAWAWLSSPGQSHGGGDLPSA